MKNKITKANFLAWLRKQPATREFNFLSNEGCLFASFLSERCKLKGVSCGGIGYSLWGQHEIRFRPWMGVMSRRVVDELKINFTVSDVRKLLKN